MLVQPRAAAIVAIPRYNRRRRLYCCCSPKQFQENVWKSTHRLPEMRQFIAAFRIIDTKSKRFCGIIACVCAACMNASDCV